MLDRYTCKQKRINANTQTTKHACKLNFLITGYFQLTEGFMQLY